MILLTKINNIVFTDKALYNYHIRQRESLTQKLRLDLYDYILDNTKFGINLCRKYNLEDQIDNYINVYISNTINYMQSVVKSSIPMKDKYKIISHIMFESTFIENIESYNCPSIYYRVLKRVCMKKNIFIFVLMVKLKNIIRK